MTLSDGSRLSVQAKTEGQAVAMAAHLMRQRASTRWPVSAAPAATHTIPARGAGERSKA